MIILDASVLIAYLAEQDPHHGGAKDVLARDDQFTAHTMTMAEALVRGARKGRLDELAMAYDVLGIGEPPRIAGEARALAQLRAATGMRLPDCCVLLVAHELGGRLATFDDSLARIARSRGVNVLDGTSGGGA